MKSTDELMKEHQAIKLMLEILGVIADKLEAGGKIDIAHLEKIVDFLKTFADKCHHSKEEKWLFPAMEKAGIPREGGPIEMMLIEHNQGRDFVKKMVEAVAAYKSDHQQIAPQFAESARGYIDLLSQHIDKEEMILYPIAEMHLGDGEDAKLLSGFAKIESEAVGEGKHEEYHRLLDNLKKIYL